MMKIRNTSVLMALFISCSLQLHAQNGDKIFDHEILHEINFEFTQSNYWTTLVNNFESNFDSSIPVPYLLGNVTIDGELVDSVGVRFKGFTSYPYDSNKKPIKIDFNEFVRGKRFDGLRKLNLHIGYGDASLHRDVLAYRLMRDMGVHAPRTSWARVSFNGQYWGLYQIIEQVDREFLNRNFGETEGNLFKNKGWSHLEWEGDTPEIYQQNIELKTNEEENDWSGFMEFVNVLNNSTDAEFKEEIEKTFNVELFLKTLAVDVATNNWDSYVEHGRNYYMYEDVATGRFNWIPWDYNFSLGGGFVFGGGDDCFVWPSYASLTTGTRTAEFQDWSFGSDEITYLWDFGDGTTSEEASPTHEYATLGIYNVCLEASVGEDCIEVLCKMIDLNKNLNDCDAIVSGDFDQEADVVFASVLEFNSFCCDQWTDDCEELKENVEAEINGTSSGFSIDQTGNNKILINRLLAVPEYQEIYYEQFCELMENVMVEDRIFDIMDTNFELIDLAAAEEPYSLFTYEDFLEDIGQISEEEGLKAIFTSRIEGLNEELPEIYTCPVASAQVAFGEVSINEIVASNDSIGGEADPAGGYPDWIELYNTQDFTIDLSDVYLSDDFTDLRKWQFPDGTMIDAHDYLIVWADNDLDQPGIHASFKLSKGGEQLYLSNAVGTMIDSISFGEQKTNVAFARVPNGIGDFKFWTTTFDRSNDDGVSDTADDIFDRQVKVYPNPSSGLVNVSVQGENNKSNYLELLNSSGQLLYKESNFRNSTSLDLEQYPSGIYLIRIINAEGNMSNKRITKVH